MSNFFIRSTLLLVAALPNMLKYYQKRFTIKNLIDWLILKQKLITTCHYIMLWTMVQTILLNSMKIGNTFQSNHVIQSIQSCFIKLVDNEFFSSADSGIIKTDEKE